MTYAEYFEKQPFTLALSSGFFGFFAHIGFVKALSERHLTPQRYTGSSAGALVAASLASDIPVNEIEKIFISLRRDDFWDPRPGFGFLKGQKFEETLKKYIHPDFSKMGSRLQVSTFDILARKTKIFSEGDLPKICRASCSVPGFFHPVMIEGRPYWDGGIFDKMGTQGLPEKEVVLSHYLQADGWVDRFERLRINSAKPESIHILALKNLPISGPTKLDLGPEIIEAAFLQTRELLKTQAPENHLQSLR